MRLFYIVCFSMVFSGCASIQGIPKPPINVDNTINNYHDDLEKLADHPPTDCEGVREGISKALTVIDLRYAEFVDDISLESKTKNTATDFTLIGLGLAGTAVGGAGAKTILHAISTGVTAANTSIDKNYFYEKALPALVSQMNADRKEKLSMIVQRSADCRDGSYSWFEALHDLIEYYAAGTLLGAISSIPKDAGVRQAASEREIKETLKLTPSPTTADKTRLRNWWQTGDREQAKKTIMDCWEKVNPDLFNDNRSGTPRSPCATGRLHPAKLINEKSCAEDHPKVLKCIDELEK